MIELQIEEIFVPIGLPFTLKELDLEIKTENKEMADGKDMMTE